MKVAAGAQASDPAAMIAGEELAGANPDEVRRLIGIYGDLAELLQRVRERARREGASNAEAERVDSGLEQARRRLAFWATRHQELVAVHLEPDLRRLSSGRRTVRLTGRESELLKFLLDHPGRRYPAPLLATLAWHDSGLCAEQVRTYVARLRRKLREADAQLDISSQRRLGYGVAGTQRGAGARDRTDEA